MNFKNLTTQHLEWEREQARLLNQWDAATKITVELAGRKAAAQKNGKAA